MSISPEHRWPIAPLWGLPVYLDLLPEVDPYRQLEYFRSRDAGFNGNTDFWKVPSPEPLLPDSFCQALSSQMFCPKVAAAVKRLAQLIWSSFLPEKLVLVAILRAGVPLANSLARMLPGAAVVATSLFVGLGIDKIALQRIRSDYPGRQIVFVDGWTGKGGVADELRALDVGPLAVLSDPWQVADLSGTLDDILSPSAFFTGPTTLGFSRTFQRSPMELLSAYRFPKQLLMPGLVEAWQLSQPTTIELESQSVSANALHRSRIHHATALRVHSNEVCRALVNSNPGEILFRDRSAVAREKFGWLAWFADECKVPQRFGVGELSQLDCQVACTLRLRP